ncbi:MAG: hypothetical protein OEU09_13510 [Rhodospirillales bacterium]|nr:hypothetical protein [Rhodospirillales bacterium]MDH3792531.1 hypothetical protein [Rhodospirillales bacterium]MDH3912305.1 hypothetical protein [Rhodospirillales bacterium]MDH3919387.1 hypothetical protein [Rhodospirillales bacterium]MDH3969333.1 hypothetical protein [Rhodospirillales bacterium]
MRKKTKIALLVLSHLVLAGLGLYAGLELGFWRIPENFKESLSAKGGWTLLAAYGDYVEYMRSHGDRRTYREALLEFDAALEQGRGGGNPPISETMYHTSRLLNNTRLSLLESKLGNPEAAWQHIDVAAEECTMMTWEDCTPRALIAALERIERHLWALEDGDD